MFFPVQEFKPPVELYCAWEKGFSPEECAAIVELAELQEFRQGSVGANKVDLDARDSNVTWLQPSQETHWIFERITAIIARVNFDKYQMDLDGIDGIQYTKYGSEQHYDWHTDHYVNEPVRMHRKLSLSIVLTDDTHYEGGELVFNNTGNPDRLSTIRPTQGTFVFFYSFLPHKVAPVTKGERVSLVTWVLGPKFR